MNGKGSNDLKWTKLGSCNSTKAYEHKDGSESSNQSKFAFWNLILKKMHGKGSGDLK